MSEDEVLEPTGLRVVLPGPRSVILLGGRARLSRLRLEGCGAVWTRQCRGSGPRGYVTFV